VVQSIWVEPAGQHAIRPAGHPAVQTRQRDRIFAALLIATSATECLLRSDLTWRPLSFLLGCLIALATMIRRSQPLPATLFGFGGIAVLDLAATISGHTTSDLWTASFALLLAYSLFRWGSGQQIAKGFIVLTFSFAIIIVADFTGLADTVGGAAVLLFTAALGVAVRYRNTVLAQLIEQAKLTERAQLARELHDTVAHHMTGIAIQAQAGLFLARSTSQAPTPASEGAINALGVIHEEAAKALLEMRSMVGALRDPGQAPELAPPKTLADITHMSTYGIGMDGIGMDGIATHGLANNELTVDVELHGDLKDLSPAVEAAFFRVAQESITNARRHAYLATRVTVRVSGSPSEVSLSITDNGTRAGIPVNTAGFGLVGMTERVNLLGGTLTAGPRTNNGWAVQATLPRS
jgi:signal transduction histidine kinase